MTQLLSYAYFEVIDARSAAAQERLGRHYLLILQSQPAWGVYQVTVQRGGGGREIEPLGYPCAKLKAKSRQRERSYSSSQFRFPFCIIFFEHSCSSYKYNQFHSLLPFHAKWLSTAPGEVVPLPSCDPVQFLPRR